MDKDKSCRSVLELPPTVRPLQFEEHGISTEEGCSSTTGDPVGKKVVESELTPSPEMATTLEFKPMSSETVRLMSKAIKRRADYENEPITKDSERSVRRQENARKGYGNNSFYEEPEKIRDTQEGSHLEKSMKETPILRYRTPTVESKDFDMGPLSQQLDIGSQAMDKNDTSDRRAVGKEIKVIADEVDRWEDNRSPEYIPSSEVENHHPCLALDSPSTKQHRIENTRKSHMATASNALDYYHSKHPGDDYTPVHINLKHVIFLVDTRGYYIHINFTARNTKDGTEKIFFAELYLSFEGQDDEWVVTACDIVGPESLGGLRHIWCPDGIAFVGDTMDVQNCYACDDFIKHIDGTMYEAGHRGHCAYEVTDISEE